MTNDSQYSINAAVNDFYRARNKAMLKEIIGFITGKSTKLLSYEDVKQKLKLQGSSDRGLKEIPLNSIVGSLGRYSDFTRDFLPRKETVKNRWTRIKQVATGLVGFPPIEVYQVGDAYFIKDGNHRVSVAKQLGATYIQAYVTAVRTRVPLSPDDNAEDIILKSEYAQFLEKTRLDELRSDMDLRVSVTGQYEIIEEHISIHQYFMGIDLQRDITYQDALLDWYDSYYLPIVQVIRQQGILRYFPDRTETDLYLWISEHRTALEEQLGWQLQTDTAIRSLVKKVDRRIGTLLNNLKNSVVDTLSGGKLLSGPPPGHWREVILSSRNTEQLFRDLLVPIRGDEFGWCALEQAIVIAKREGAMLHGLHVTPLGNEENLVVDIQNEFSHRCKMNGVNGKLVFASGEVSRVICERARYTDLIVTNLSYPPGLQPLERLESGFHDMVHKCPRPILATPKNMTDLTKGLLAYDGSPKAKEALFISTYLLAKWQIELVVLSVGDSKHNIDHLIHEADKYLKEHSVNAIFVTQTGDVPELILQTSQEHHCDFILLGGYGYNPLIEVVLGSTVNHLLQNSHLPMLICR